MQQVGSCPLRSNASIETHNPDKESLDARQVLSPPKAGVPSLRRVASAAHWLGLGSECRVGSRWMPRVALAGTGDSFPLPEECLLWNRHSEHFAFMPCVGETIFLCRYP